MEILWPSRLDLYSFLDPFHEHPRMYAPIGKQMPGSMATDNHSQGRDCGDVAS